MIILASTSPYKIAQFRMLNLDFKSLPPNVDESEIQKDPNLSPKEKAEALALKKAQALQKDYFADTIVAGDQLAFFDEQVLTKTASREKNIEQLLCLQSKSHYLYTSNIILKANEKPLIHTEIAKMTMKKLSRLEIENYVDKDKAWDCAGGYKFETKAGEKLFESVEVNDMSSIQGMCMGFLKKNFLL